MPNLTIEELIKTARALNESDQFDEVIALLPLKSVAEYRNDELSHELARAFAGRSNVLLQEPDIAGAINDLGRAIKLDPQNGEYHFMRAYILGLCNEEENAIKDFTRAIGLNPHSEKYFYYRGMLYNKVKSFEEAIADFDRVNSLNPHHADAYIARAYSWSAKKEYDKSILDLTASILLAPGISEAWHNRGAAWYDKKEYDKGIEDLSQAIFLRPDFASSYFERGLNYEGKAGEGDEDKEAYDKAVEDYSQSIRLDPGLIAAWFQRAGVWKIKKEYHKAIGDYTKVIGMNRKYPGAHFNRGIAWYELGDYSEAVVNFKWALVLKPDDKEAGIWLDKAEAKFRESPGGDHQRQSVREEAAAFIERIVKEYGMKFKGHQEGFVHGDKTRISSWDPVKGCPVRAGINGWLPAVRPDLAKWQKQEGPWGGEWIFVFTHKDTEFNPEDAGLPITKELWDAIAGDSLFEFGEEFLGKVRKFDKVAPLLNRIAGRIRGGDLDEGLIFT